MVSRDLVVRSPRRAARTRHHGRHGAPPPRGFRDAHGRGRGVFPRGPGGFSRGRRQDILLVVVDTPPTRDALAFLEAPKLLTRLLDNPIYKVVTASNKGLIGVANRAAQGVLRQLARVVGAAVVDEAVVREPREELAAAEVHEVVDEALRAEPAQEQPQASRQSSTANVVSPLAAHRGA